MVRPDRRTTLLGPLKRAHLAVRTLADGTLRPFGLTIAQYSMLRHLADNPGISGAELARLVRITPASVAGMLSVLEQDGRVERTPDPAGGRCLLARTTPAADELLEQVWPAIQWLEEELFEGVPDADRDTFRRVLDAIVDRQAELLAPRRLGPPPTEVPEPDTTPTERGPGTRPTTHEDPVSTTHEDPVSTTHEDESTAQVEERGAIR
ncbi:MarR family winged helix-turn-helix transcriptional regulator [Raineyella sp. W15-4]|uniref:MarR family winged helix-turn-helix transcriptional regulator n=1 Tax=Raineyella sp. W15-4 TaxID=3081651 RepID=UPI002954D342|nr:MarR family winged helix-turn-helix transcriptional regulator [Raineyella sp. W15-4]WOQ17653.1 MarR family winged helix-turn-helix transcriptional regulator [Raineyella sp. W15-4]